MLYERYKYHLEKRAVVQYGYGPPQQPQESLTKKVLKTTALVGGAALAYKAIKDPKSGPGKVARRARDWFTGTDGKKKKNKIKKGEGTLTLNSSLDLADKAKKMNKGKNKKVPVAVPTTKPSAARLESERVRGIQNPSLGQRAFRNTLEGKGARQKRKAGEQRARAQSTRRVSDAKKAYDAGAGDRAIASQKLRNQAEQQAAHTAKNQAQGEAKAAANKAASNARAATENAEWQKNKPKTTALPVPTTKPKVTPVTTRVPGAPKKFNTPTDREVNKLKFNNRPKGGAAGAVARSTVSAGSALKKGLGRLLRRGR